MVTEQRNAPRVRCFLPAIAAKGDVILEELSVLGCRLQCSFPVNRDEVLQLHVYSRSTEADVEAVACRTSTTPLGCRVACRIAENPAARETVSSLFGEVAGANAVRVQ
ncbi:MAG: hypothetical protein HYY16_14175 [Planctomycetes bacterium]|nr:hypothetical protein [Planctomycetota bacterium]